jgi:hypothetical protein
MRSCERCGMSEHWACLLQDQQYVEVVSGLQELRMHEGPSATDESAANNEEAGDEDEDWLAL